MLLKVKNVEAENQKLKNKMSKYNLSDLLNEISGTSRVGTLNISAKELVDKMDDLEARGIEVDRLDGLSPDGKTNIEFHVFPEGKDELDAAFTVYDFKFGFDPMDEEHFMTEYPFSVGGKGGSALKYAKELVGAESFRMEENKEEMKEEKKELPDAIKKAEQAQIEKDAKKAKGMMKEDDIDPYYDLRRIKQEVRNQLDSFDKGIIDGDDLANALEEIIFGRRAPGMMEEEDAIEDEPVTEEMFGPVKFLKSKGISDEMISDFMKMHSKDIIGASEDEILDEFENFRSVNYDYIDENLQNHFARFLKDYQ